MKPVPPFAPVGAAHFVRKAQLLSRKDQIGARELLCADDDDPVETVGLPWIGPCRESQKDVAVRPLDQDHTSERIDEIDTEVLVVRTPQDNEPTTAFTAEAELPPNPLLDADTTLEAPSVSEPPA